MLSIVLPARNEAASLKNLLPKLISDYPSAEVIVVDDASTDDTQKVCQDFGVILICHPYSKGNGAAIKSGARTASGNYIVFMDADSQHNADDIKGITEMLDRDYDMVVGARNAKGQASLGRGMANMIYNRLASVITGHHIMDLTSGFRGVRSDRFREFLYMLPNGFSYPSTITMAFFRAGYSVKYVPIEVNKRDGKSHIKPVSDGIKFLLIIFRITTLYSPLKIFAPIGGLFFITGLTYYLYTFVTEDRFTNMSALLLLSSILIFLIGLVSEQITMLLYKK